MAAQEEGIRKRNNRRVIDKEDKEDNDSSCKMCGE